MPPEGQKKMLVALDGSDRAFETIRYISEIPTLQAMHLRLLSIKSKIPENYWDLENAPQYGRRIKDIRTWEVQQQKSLEEYMGEARQRLLDSGFGEETVDIRIQQRRSGVARDIIKEAKKGYDAVAVGRKGWSRLKDLLLGNVAMKLIEEIRFVPLLVVGRRYPEPTRVLIALDGSEGAMHALDFAISIFAGCARCDVILAHVIRSEDKSFIAKHREKILPVLNMSKSQLLNRGFRPGHITTKIITGVESRAGALVRMADEGGYGTIVLGRRGISKRREFFMGRVSNKVIQLGRTKAVWVIS
jgi:nucleotide-binding universal stress UspA family protein